MSKKRVSFVNESQPLLAVDTEAKIAAKLIAV
jgi:hypothetical protein